MLDGEVQGVGLRESVKTQADRLGLVGQVMNLKDGRVGVVCEGNQDSINELVGKLRGSPGLATVDNASVSYSESEGEYDSFIVVRGDSDTEMIKITSAGVEQLKIMNGKLKIMNGKLGNIEEGVNDIKEGVRRTHDKLDVMNETIQEGFRRTHDKLDVMNETIQEGFRRTHDKLDVMNETIQEGFRRTHDKLDVMNETAQEGFRRVRA